MEENASTPWSLHLGLFVAEAICAYAFYLELSRALSGNTLSWAYVVEWPILGAYGVYMWRKLLKQSDSPEESVTPKAEEHDSQLTAWNDYLAQVHRDDGTKADPH